ncbi:single-stranded DNA-binding protein [Cyanobium sp. ATX 6A2]|uniref:single-stranded DNA-binding protein n=1 Tax=Cyanobium sp. ATX 6A2 TaxID=2823700 RepID=UPI0020CF0941|nr:single-stranded DNA-binding protein [Cyanobium sp. ATX 6A2]MCP9889101.1 single-stranded DNA-binding protein [Cyanobium sp. ATX 6A2]
MSINTITLVGRAGRDPETRFFESGSVVTNLSLAVNRPSREEEPDWFNLEIWGKQAQVAADYVRKGSLIGVIGRMTSEQWTDRNTGERRSKPVVKVDRLALLGSRADSATAPPVEGQTTAQAVAPAGTPISDEEVPF